MNEAVLEVRHITKTFPGVTALSDVSMSFNKGEVHALLGENGAGKSTLIKIISGVYEATKGEVLLEGKPLSNMTVKKGIKLGIAAIQQELNLIPELTIAENVFLGMEQTTLFSFLKEKQMVRETQELLNRFNVDLNPTSRIRDLSISQQQIVAIMKAMKVDSKVFILDEPTDVLTDKETDILFNIIRELKAQQKVIIYISHRLDELPIICDTFSVLRDGHYVGSGKIADCSKTDIIKLMIGRDLNEQFPYKPAECGEVVFQMNGCVRKDFGGAVNLTVHAGEVVGLYGLVGSGRSELMRCVVGADHLEAGHMEIMGKTYKGKSVAAAHRAGIYYSTEDRKRDGIIAGQPIDFNMTLPSLKRVSRASVLNSRKEQQVCSEMKTNLSIKTPSLKTDIVQLSGGNQQKALLGKALLTQPKVLILDEPTRGIDVGTKADIYNIILMLKEQGTGIIVISSELPEVMGICDRIIVLKKGEVMGEFSHEEATESRITNNAFGIVEQGA